VTKPDHLLLGEGAEQLVRRRLERAGWSFQAANWRCAAGEIDLVMRDGDELVFVEVKARHGEGSGRAEESVSARKAGRLLATAEWYLSMHQDLDHLIWRVDLVALTLDQRGTVIRTTHVKNAIVTG
jgi:putative endonuclease